MKMRTKWVLALGIAIVVSCLRAYAGEVRPLTQTATPLPQMANAAGSAPPVAQNVDDARLANARAESRNWLTYYGAYDGQRFSLLSQITTHNVSRLRAAWAFQYGVIGLQATPATFAFEATPIVVDGVMFVSGWNGYVWAIDAATGRLLWEYQYAIPLDVPLCCGNVNRGVAVARGKVFVATANGHILALNARNGSLVWDRIFADVREGESATVAPLVVKHLVLVGASGGEYGVRGHIDAFDTESAVHVWRLYTVPKPGEPGGNTWGGDSWARGGGATWVTGSYDPQLNLVYWGVGNPGSDFNGAERPGDNLYTDSVIAFNPDTGKIQWHYQWTPHDVWDYDGVSENILVDRDGRKLLAHLDKNGYFFVLDRTNGTFVHATAYARVTWGTIDASTGKVTVLQTPNPQGVEIWPGPAGAKEWSHAAYSARTGYVYVPVIQAPATFKIIQNGFRESLPYWGGDATVSGQNWGELKAIDVLTGRQMWTRKLAYPAVGSMLATAGGLVFTGEPTGEVDALDARTGKLLWQFQTGSGIHGSPVAYMVHGKQYIAVPSGWGGWLKGFAPRLLGGARGNTLYAFSLP